MQLVLKFSGKTGTSVSHFNLSWCVTREDFEEKKIFATIRTPKKKFSYKNKKMAESLVRRLLGNWGKGEQTYSGVLISNLLNDNKFLTLLRKRFDVSTIYNITDIQNEFTSVLETHMKFQTITRIKISDEGQTIYVFTDDDWKIEFFHVRAVYDSNYRTFSRISAFKEKNYINSNSEFTVELNYYNGDNINQFSKVLGDKLQHNIITLKFRVKESVTDKHPEPKIPIDMLHKLLRWANGIRIKDKTGKSIH